MIQDSTGSGKGDEPRPMDQKKWSEGWDRIFGGRKTYKPKPKVKIKGVKSDLEIKK